MAPVTQHPCKLLPKSATIVASVYNTSAGDSHAVVVATTVFMQKSIRQGPPAISASEWVTDELYEANGHAAHAMQFV